MKKKHFLLAAIGGIILITAYFMFMSESTRNSGPYSSIHKHADSVAISKLRWLDSANVNSDLDSAISKGDFRLFGIFGYAAYVPGIERREDSLNSIAGIRYSDSSEVAIAGVRYIEGTSDALLSDEHARLVHLAQKYAKQYNQLMLQYLIERKAR